MPSGTNWSCAWLQTLHERVDAGLAAEAEARRRGDGALRGELLDELEASRNELLQRSETSKLEAANQAQALAEEVRRSILLTFDRIHHMHVKSVGFPGAAFPRGRIRRCGIPLLGAGAGAGANPLWHGRMMRHN
eukprot:8262206-Pyramimonas_sp.AAC.1